jgi:hypothetical protein
MELIIKIENFKENDFKNDFFAGRFTHTFTQ